MFQITFYEISTTLYIYIDILDAYGTVIMFILWNHISTISYEDRECCLHILPKLSNERIKLTLYSKNECKTRNPGAQFCK